MSPIVEFASPPPVVRPSGRDPRRSFADWYGALSLRSRLWMIFTGLMALAVVFGMTLLMLQHRMARTGADRVVRQTAELERTLRLKEALAVLSREASDREHRRRDIDEVRAQLRELRAHEDTGAGLGLLQSGIRHFDQYAETSLKTERLPQGGAVADARLWLLDETVASIESYIAFQQDTIYRVAEESRRRQDQAVRTALVFLGLFLLALWFAASRAITAVTRPLTELTAYIDQLGPEGAFSGPPAHRWRLPEIRHVAASFERLLQRLRGYRAIDLHRLLIEKRRADVIAAAISDGIFLLRGEELLYANPVGERILGLPAGTPWKGLRASALRPSPGGEDPPAATRGARAIFGVAQQTMPVEFELREEGRRQAFLLESFALSEELLERVQHSFDGPFESLLERWQANTLVVARDVTLVRESREAKSHFIATLSHEVKTPVTSLTMATRLLRKSIDQFPSATHRALIETCAEDVDRLRVLIDDLLSVSRFDTLTQRLDPSRVDFAKLLRQTVQHFQPQSFERGVEIVSRLPATGTLFARMDAAKISWALSNLMINALRHTPRGGRVEVALEATPDGRQAVVSIRDHGPGIERERQARLFEKFNAFYDLRVARSGSLGMGLAIAREIVHAHRGRIWVVSEPGQGAEFCFSLPLREEPGLNPNTSRGDGDGVGRPGPPGGGAIARASAPAHEVSHIEPMTKGEVSGTSARG